MYAVLPTGCSLVGVSEEMRVSKERHMAVRSGMEEHWDAGTLLLELLRNSLGVFVSILDFFGRLSSD